MTKKYECKREDALSPDLDLVRSSVWQDHILPKSISAEGPETVKGMFLMLPIMITR
jgi:hypothetical protein